MSAPFHCSLMKPAQDRLEVDLNALKMQKPAYPVACNVEGSLVSDELRARSTLVAQVTGSVKWEQCMRLLIEQGVEIFVEIGPGKVLCGLMRQIDRSRTCLNVGDEASLTKTLQQFGNQDRSRQLAKFQIARRHADCFVGFVHVQLGVLRAIVHDQVNDNASTTAGTVAGAINLITLHNAPLAAGAPILPEFVKRILRVILRMLLPFRIVIVDAVGGFEILLLQGRKEFVCNVRFRPEAVPPDTENQEYNKNDRRNNPRSSLPLARGGTLSRPVGSSLL